MYILDFEQSERYLIFQLIFSNEKTHQNKEKMGKTLIYI